MVATDQLNKSNEIGKGGFGRVCIHSQKILDVVTAAIKVLTKVSMNALEFMYDYKLCAYHRKELL